MTFKHTLSALAAQTGPPKTAERDDPKQPGNPAVSVPAELVPQRMIDTLDRYERMKKSVPSAG